MTKDILFAAGLHEKVISPDFEGWILGCQYVDQFSTMCNVVCSFEGLLNLMSFVYTNTLISSTATSFLMRSLIKIEKRRGPKTGP